MAIFDENYNEIKEGLDFVFSVQDAIVQATADGVVDATDLTVLFPVFNTAKKGFEGLGNPIERFKAFSDEQREAILDYVRERFDLTDDILEILIEDSLLTLVNIIRVSTRWAKFVK